MGRSNVTSKDLSRLDAMARAKMDADPAPAVMGTVRRHLELVARYRSWGLRWDQIAEAFAEADLLGMPPTSSTDDRGSAGALRPVKAETLRSAAHRANKETGETYELDRGAGHNWDNARTTRGE